MTSIYTMAEKFQKDIHPPYDMSEIVSQLSHWIQTNQDALLLAWYAQYGFEPGKAVLVHKYDLGEGSQFFVREMTDKEKSEYKIDVSKYETQNIYTEGQA